MRIALRLVKWRLLPCTATLSRQVKTYFSELCFSILAKMDAGGLSANDRTIAPCHQSRRIRGIVHCKLFGGTTGYFTTRLDWILGSLAGGNGLSGSALPHICTGFWGFGESGKKVDDYSVDVFVSMVDQFIVSWELPRLRWSVTAWGNSKPGVAISIPLKFVRSYCDRVAD